jgi:hypothetical protein
MSRTPVKQNDNRVENLWAIRPPMNRDFAVMLSIESRLTSIANNFRVKRKISPVRRPLEAGVTLTTPRISNTKFNRSKDYAL